MTDLDLDQFVAGYVECALWSSSIEEDFLLNSGTGTIRLVRTSLRMRRWTRSASLSTISTPSAWRLSARSVQISLRITRLMSRPHAIAAWSKPALISGLPRNRHGAGFWDRGLPDDLGERLSEAAYAYGEAYLYVANYEQPFSLVMG